VRRTRNEECKDESVYIIMQAWGLCRDETYKLIAENEIFATKNEIKFQGAELTVNAVKYVSSSQHSTNIEKFIFECSGFENDWIKVLIESSQIKDLHISFDHTGLDKMKNNSLADVSKFFPKLKGIRFDCLKGVNEKLVTKMLLGEWITQVETLILTGTDLNDEGVKALSESQHLSKVNTLDLSNTNVTSKAVMSIASSSTFSELSNLNLGGNKGVDDEGVKALSESQHLSKVNTLDLSNTNVTSKAFISIASSSTFSELSNLNFSGNKGVNDEGVKALSESQHLSKVNTLDLSRTCVDVWASWDCIDYQLRNKNFPLSQR
jgi:hypothetical protein